MYCFGGFDYLSWRINLIIILRFDLNIFCFIRQLNLKTHSYLKFIIVTNKKLKSLCQGHFTIYASITFNDFFRGTQDLLLIKSCIFCSVNNEILGISKTEHKDVIC